MNKIIEKIETIVEEQLDKVREQPIKTIVIFLVVFYIVKRVFFKEDK